MKHKSALFATMILLLISCVDEAPDFIDLPQANKISSKYTIRSPHEAISIAQNALSLLSDSESHSSRNTSMRQIDLSSDIQIITNTLKSRSQQQDTLMYVVNYKDNRGFAIVSALKNTPDLLAITTSGTYNSKLDDFHPGFQAYMATLTDYLHTMSERKDTFQLIDPGTGIIRPRIYEKQIYDTIWIHNVPNRVKVYWGQQELVPNAYPNGVAGCSNVAAAMLMTYYEHPANIKLTHLNNKPTIALNWAKMRKHKTSKDAYDNCNQDTEYPIHERIGQLCREIGHRSYSSYNNDSTTGTLKENTMTLLQSLGYQISRFNSYKKFDISSHLAPNAILLLSGKNKNGNHQGHMWLCDGVKHYKIRSRYYQSNDEGKTWILKNTDYSAEVAYNHYNWGWNGSDCGYFLDLTFSPNPSKDYSDNLTIIKVWR